jgi:glutamate:GABA antiporter
MTRRRMRFLDLVLFTLATSISIRWLPAAAAAGPVSLFMWAAAMLGFMVPLIVATMELTARFPGEGGLYAWAREALGPFAGFVCGWLYWTCNLPFFSGLLVFIVNALALAAGPHWGAVIQQPPVFLGVSLALAIGVAVLHLLGLGAGKWVSNFGTTAMFGLLAVLVAAGLARMLGPVGPATDLVHTSWRPPFDADGAILWSIMVFAFGGPESLAFLRDEIEGGAKKVVQILTTVGVLQVLAYGVGTLAMLAILTPAENSRLSGVPQALATGLMALGLPGLTPAALVLLALAFLGGYSAWFGVAARLPFAAGVDDVLPSSFGYRSPRTGAPVVSILVQALATVVLVAVGQGGANLRATYDFLVSMSVLSYTLPFLFLFTIYLKVQGRPAPADGWTPPGGAWTARIVGAAGLLVTVSAVLCTLAPSPDVVDKAGAVTKLVVSSGVLVLSGVAAWALAWFRKRRVSLAGAS